MIIDCEVLEVDKPHRLTYTWAVGPDHHTNVAWTLTAAENGVTQLHLAQSGFSSEATQEIGGAKYGWTRMLEQLQNLLASA